MNNSRPDSYDDEIELIDIFRVLWKWKVLIALGTLLFGLLAYAYCLTVKKTYRVEMTVQPGLMYSADNGTKRALIDSIDSIVGRINAGIYDDTIIERAIKGDPDQQPEGLDLNVQAPAKADVLQVAYETTDSAQGIRILNVLFELLQGQEAELIRNTIESLNRKISLDKIELEKKKHIEESYIVNVKNIEQRIGELKADITIINENSGYLNEQRKKLLGRDTDAEGALSVLLYSNTIQQNIQFVNAVKKDLNEHMLLREMELQKVIGVKNDQKVISENIYKNEKIRDHIVKMQLIKKPTAGKYPVKPKKRLVVLMSVFMGFVVMVFLSFFMEYLRNHPLSPNDGAR